MPCLLHDLSLVLSICWWPFCCGDSGAGLQQQLATSKMDWLVPLCVILVCVSLRH